MKRIIFRSILIFFTLTLVSAIALSQSGASGEQARYPNEIANLKLYEQAKWKAIVPYVSTRDDVERILGEPRRVYDRRFYDQKFNDYLVGYVDDPNWIMIVTYIGEGGMPDFLIGRVFDITLYPRSRVSLEGVEFPSVFTRHTYKDRDNEFVVFGDKCGLAYVIYSKVSATSVHHRGDLKLIRYAVSDQDEKRLTHSEESKALATTCGRSSPKRATC